MHEKANKLNNKGVDLYNLGKMTEAIACYNQALVLDKKCTVAWYNKGMALHDLGQTVEAIACFDQALALDKKYTAAWYGKGLALRALGQTVEAIVCFDQALALDKKHTYARNNKCTALLDLGQTIEAIACFDQALALDKKYTYAWNGKGVALERLGQNVEAIACFDQALALDKKLTYAWNGKGAALRGLGQTIEAIACFDQALALDKKYTYAWNGKGLALHNLGQTVEAIACFDQALALDKKNTDAWNYKAFVFLLTHNLKNAQESLNAPVLREDKSLLHRAVEEFYYFASKYDSRLFDILDKYIEQPKNSQKIREQLIVYEWAVRFFIEYGALEEAASCLQRGFALQKDNPRLQQLAKSLQVHRDKVQVLSTTTPHIAPLSSIKPQVPSDIKTESSKIFIQTIPPTGPLQQIAWSTVTVGALVGQGGYGDVYQGEWQGVNVAIKQLHLKTLSTSLLTDFEQEAKIMAQCQFPHIVRLYGVCLQEGHTAMVMEYLSKGSLYHVLHDDKETLPWNPIRWSIALDIGKGLMYLHNQKIIHRDLKSLNVLLDSQYQAKISDFGLSKIKLESSSISTKIHKGMGTTRWRAPELFKRKASPNEASDMYSYGMTLWEIASRQLPFADAQDDVTVMGFIKDGEKEEIPQDCPKEYSDLVQQCWDLPDKRPSARTLVSALVQAKPQEILQPESKLYEEKSWHFDPQTKAKRPAKDKIYELVEATDKDKRKVIEFYQHHPVAGYDMAAVRVIYNPDMNYKFGLYLKELQQRNNNPAFQPKWPTGKECVQDPIEPQENINWRGEVHQQLQIMAKSYQDSDYPCVNLLPMWHGTKAAIVDSIFRTGYANLAQPTVAFLAKGFMVRMRQNIRIGSMLKVAHSF